MQRKFGWALAATVLVAGVVASIAGGRHGQDLEARSDQFWRSLAFAGLEAEHYSTLDEMAGAADIVVLGHLDSIELGRRFQVPAPDGTQPEDATFQYAAVTIREDASIFRLADAPKSYTLEFMVPPNTSIKDLKQNLPTEQAIFFLRSKGLDLVRRGKSRDAVATSMPFVRLVSSQGLVRNIEGLAHPNPEAEDQFLLALVHTPFKDVLSTVTAEVK